MNHLESLIRAAQNAVEGDRQDWDYGHPAVMQGLIDTGSIWHLEGSAGRAAMQALESGACFLPSVWTDGVERPLTGENMVTFTAVLKAPLRDYYGNLIPYRELVKPGSKGSLENSARFYDLAVPRSDYGKVAVASLDLPVTE